MRLIMVIFWSLYLSKCIYVGFDLKVKMQLLGFKDVILEYNGTLSQRVKFLIIPGGKKTTIEPKPNHLLSILVNGKNKNDRSVILIVKFDF